jgi:hypothetical protein
MIPLLLRRPQANLNILLLCSCLHKGERAGGASVEPGTTAYHYDPTTELHTSWRMMTIFNIRYCCDNKLLNQEYN